MRIRYLLPFAAALALIVPVANGALGLANGAVPNTLRDWVSPTVTQASVRLFLARCCGVSTHPDKALVGTDGFFFLGNRSERVVDKTTGAFRPPLTEIEAWMAGIAANKARLAAAGIPFAMVLTPNKHSVMSENLPDGIMLATPNITDDIVAAAAAQGVPMLDLRPVIDAYAQNNDAFFKSDSHWTRPAGAEAFRAVMTFLSELVARPLALPQWDFIRVMRPPGELISMLGFQAVVPKDYEPVDYYTPRTEQVCVSTVTLEDWQQAPCADQTNPEVVSLPVPLVVRNPAALNPLKMLLICDSFCVAMSPLLQASFGEIHYVHWTHIGEPGFAGYLDALKPDAVVYMIVERAFYNASVSTPF